MATPESDKPLRPKPKTKKKRRRRKSAKTATESRKPSTQAAAPSAQAAPSKPPPKPKPWERQPGESSRAFKAFQMYLDMGEERSLRKLAEKLVTEWGVTGAYVGQIERYSSRFGWVARVDAFDEAYWAARRAKRQHKIDAALEVLVDAAKPIAERLRDMAKGYTVDPEGRRTALEFYPSDVQAAKTALTFVVPEKKEVSGAIGVYPADPPDEPEEDYGSLTAAEIEKRYSEMTKQAGKP